MASPAPRAATDFWGNLERRINIEWLAATAAMLMLTLGLSYFSGPIGLTRLDYAFYDWTLASAAPVRQQEDIVIIAIDDGSIEQIGYWPWRRALHARLLEQLGQARVVGFDLVLSDLNPAYPGDDAQLARAIAQHGKVVLPLIVDNGRRQVLPPQPPLAKAAAALGFINIYPDGDGVIRSLTLRQHLSSGRNVDHFIIAMLETAGQAVPAPPDEPLLIPYARGSAPFVLYSYKQVLDGAVPAAALKDKYVLVGSWGSGLGDAFPTPLSRQGEAMAGVEILANGLLAALHGSWVTEPQRWQIALLACLPVLLACVALRRLSPGKAFLSSVVVLLLTFAGSWLALRFGQRWVPFTASLIGVAVAYPVWSWRSQVAALKHIDHELHTLNQEQKRLDGSLPAHTKRYGHTLSARVSLLHETVTQLRRARNNREETLHFLSHDMRAPQNSILALTELQLHSDTALSQDDFLQRVNGCANKTLILVDGFVQLARAEAASMNRHPINLVDLVTQGCDSYWASAKGRNISIEFSDTPDEAWSDGDGVLLQRAWDNLLDNAVKYSPSDTVIQCRIRPEASSWELSVRDQGRGMTEAQRQALFRPFTRFGEDNQDHPAGAGLGLAFVKTVIERHKGTISVDSLPGRGTIFTVALPRGQAPYGG